MNELFAVHNRAFRLWLDTAQAGADAMTTVAMRLPMMAASQLAGKGPTGEDRRMVSEKVDAMMEGVFDGARSANDLAWRAITGQLNPTRLAHGMLAVADAAQRPARKRVKANARRLTGLS